MRWPSPKQQLHQEEKYPHQHTNQLCMPGCAPALTWLQTPRPYLVFLESLSYADDPMAIEAAALI